MGFSKPLSKTYDKLNFRYQPNDWLISFQAYVIVFTKGVPDQNLKTQAVQRDFKLNL